MRSSIGKVALRFAVTIALFAPDGFARDPSSINLCPPSLRMTERDGCQPSNGALPGSVSTHVKDDAAEQLWKEIVALIDNTLPEVQYCVRAGPLRNGWTLDGAKVEISRCQQTIQKRERQRERERVRETEREHQRQVNVAKDLSFAEWTAGFLVGIASLALTIRYRARIAAALYSLFVGCLALRLRLDRSRKRFLDNAIKEAENRLG